MDDLLNNAPCGFLVFRDTGELVDVNQTLLELLGFERKELISLHIEKIFTAGGRIFYQTHFFPLLKLHGQATEIYLDLSTKSGRTIPVLVNAKRRDRNGTMLSDCVFMPVFQRNRFEDELLLAKKEAEEANRAKDEFLSVVSHELRSPLNAIVGWAKILESGKFNPELLKKGLETIQRNAEIQTHLIEDILDFSRIISGKLRLEVRELNLEEIIEKAIDIVTPAARAKGIRLNTMVDSTPGVSADADRILQVLWNILNNAVKFTPKGGRVQIRTKRINSNIEISISDTGQGISEAFLPYLFERFEQTDKTKTRRHGGLGLGLSITRHIVELHGGTIRAESPGEDLGSIFTIVLPVMITHRPEENSARLEIQTGSDKKSPAVRSRTRLNKINVLFVDDKPDARDLMSYILTEEGAGVTTAESVAEAIEKLSETDFDLVISDIEMPDEDGFSFIKRLRDFNDKHQKEIPAIALTAHARPVERLRVLSAGYKMHLAKPVDPEELITVVINFTISK